VGKEDGVRLFGVQVAVDPIADASVAQGFSALQPDITEVGELLLLRETRGKQSEQAKRVHQEAAFRREGQS
jgi:hypothetical protein